MCRVLLSFDCFAATSLDSRDRLPTAAAGPAAGPAWGATLRKTVGGAVAAAAPGPPATRATARAARRVRAPAAPACGRRRAIGALRGAGPAGGRSGRTQAYVVDLTGGERRGGRGGARGSNMDVEVSSPWASIGTLPRQSSNAVEDTCCRLFYHNKCSNKYITCSDAAANVAVYCH